MSGSVSLVLPHSCIAICLFDPEQKLQRHSSVHKTRQYRLLCLQSLQNMAHVTSKGMCPGVLQHPGTGSLGRRFAVCSFQHNLRAPFITAKKYSHFSFIKQGSFNEILTKKTQLLFNTNTNLTFQKEKKKNLKVKPCPKMPCNFKSALKLECFPNLFHNNSHLSLSTQGWVWLAQQMCVWQAVLGAKLRLAPVCYEFLPVLLKMQYWSKMEENSPLKTLGFGPLLTLTHQNTLLQRQY